MSRTAMVLGATGLIGRSCVEQLIADDDFDQIVVISRRDADFGNDKVRVQQVDFNNLDAHASAFSGITDLFCCLGTTIKVAGSQAAFRTVDHDFVVTCAELAAASGCSRLMVVSALGANASSSVFYNRVKGEMENAVSSLNFDAVHIMRPSLLLGDREETRPGEKLGQIASPILSPLLCGPLRKYRPIPGSAVASAMLMVAKSDATGVQVHHLPISRKV